HFMSYFDIVFIIAVCCVELFFFLSSHFLEEILEVLYKQKVMTPTRGETVKLSCEANYDLEKCGLVQVVWRHITKNADLTNPNKYLTTVNETQLDDNMRRRQVVTEILNLTIEDSGDFQCEAKCENGNSAMGHLITITVKSPAATLKTLMSINICMYVFFYTLDCVYIRNVYE
uniref:Ig-like domain-containing protein n=1 Tax=Seriola lalandi dorsalis TaxID=1841481 RepID=A0A3B4Y1W3_SERLL